MSEEEKSERKPITWPKACPCGYLSKNDEDNFCPLCGQRFPEPQSVFYAVVVLGESEEGQVGLSDMHLPLAYDEYELTPEAAEAYCRELGDSPSLIGRYIEGCATAYLGVIKRKNWKVDEDVYNKYARTRDGVYVFEKCWRLDGRELSPVNEIISGEFRCGVRQAREPVAP